MMLQTYIYKLNYTTCTNRLCKKKCVQKAKNMNIENTKERDHLLL